MTDTKPYFGFRVEDAARDNVIRFVSNPFYFTKHRPIDKFGEREDIQIPAGKDAAGVWFFDSIGLARAISWSDPDLITRINIGELKKDLVNEDRAHENALIAVAYYDPHTADKNSGFVKSLIVPDDLIDVWSGKTWLKKNTIDLLGMEEIIQNAEWGRYPAPTKAEIESEASSHISSCLNNGNDWKLPPSSDPIKGAGKIVKLYHIARHAITIHKLKKEELKYKRCAESSLQQDRALKSRGENAFQCHALQASSYQADARRVHHEQEMLLTGKNFWQLNDINAWTTLVLRLERIDDPSMLYREVPDSALAPLQSRINEIRHEALCARLEASKVKRNLTL